MPKNYQLLSRPRQRSSNLASRPWSLASRITSLVDTSWPRRPGRPTRTFHAPGITTKPIRGWSLKRRAVRGSCAGACACWPRDVAAKQRAQFSYIRMFCFIASLLRKTAPCRRLILRRRRCGLVDVCADLSSFSVVTQLFVVCGLPDVRARQTTHSLLTRTRRQRLICLIAIHCRLIRTFCPLVSGKSALILPPDVLNLWIFIAHFTHLRAILI